MKNAVAFAVAGAAAYSFSFAIDLLLGGLLGVYPSTAFLPGVTWSVIAAIACVIAVRLARTGRFLVIPFVVLALLAVIGGVVGHRYSLIVGLAMLAQAVGVWIATARRGTQSLPVGTTSVNDAVKRFELLVLRPLWVALGGATVFSAFTMRWLWVVGSVVGLFCLGVIGSKLHPLQSARDLAGGPTTGFSAAVEAATLPNHVKMLLVGHACTRVALLLGAITALMLIAALRLPWYIGLACAWVVVLLVGAVLKLAFRAAPCP